MAKKIAKSSNKMPVQRAGRSIWPGWPGVALGAALVAATLAAYWPALRAGFVWDDQAVTENPFLRSAAGLGVIWAHPGALPRESHYWPLVYSALWLQYQFWGLQAFGYHLVNVALHAVNAVLLWRLLRRLIPGGAWLAAALFALHPLHVESVAWIIELKDVLSACFYLLALLAWLRFARAGGRGAYGAALALFVAAMLSKSIVVTLPVALLIVLWWQRGALGRRELLPVLPLLAIAGGLAIFDVLSQRATGILTPMPPLGRVLRGADAAWFYLGKLCWPAGLMTIYPQWVYAPGAWVPWLGVLAWAGVLGGLWWGRGRLGRGPLAAVLFYGVTLGPVLGLIEFDFMRHSAVADRFAYLASIGPLALAAGGAVWGGEKLKIAPKRAAAGAAVLLAVLGVLTWRQAGLYRDNETLFGHNLKLNDKAWAAHANLGYYEIQHGQKEAARGHFEAAIRINPNCEIALGNLGVLLAQEGHLKAGAALLERALAVNPGYLEARVMLGNVCQAQKQYDAAIEHYRRALAVDSGLALAHYNLSLALAAKGLKEEALRERQEALRLKPELAGP